MTVRPATPADIPRLTALLIRGAMRRQHHDPALWRLAENAQDATGQHLAGTLGAPQPPFETRWHVAEAGGRLVGAVASMRLPVPPIYAGAMGDPGLLTTDAHVAPDAPQGTAEALLDAAEADLGRRGARLLVASFVCGEDWRRALDGRGYTPVTRYMSRTGLTDAAEPVPPRPATEADIPGITARSAEHRAILQGLSSFWDPHPDADPRFAAWMRTSLDLRDRDMRVSGPPEALRGYVIAQPASRLHFPVAHDISAIGVIDDYFHRDFADPATLTGTGEAVSLLRAAETAFAARGIDTSFVVCPDAWTSKRAVLNAAGYRTAMLWMIKSWPA